MNFKYYMDKRQSIVKILKLLDFKQILSPQAKF